MFIRTKLPLVTAGSAALFGIFGAQTLLAKKDSTPKQPSLKPLLRLEPIDELLSSAQRLTL